MLESTQYHLCKEQFTYTTDVTKTNGEWEMGNGEWGMGMGNGEWEWGMGNGEWEIEMEN